MATSPAHGWSSPRFTLRTLLIATLWLGSLLATYRHAREAGERAGNRQRLGATYSEDYPVGDLLERYTPEQIAAKLQAIYPSPWWDERKVAAGVTYRPTHGGPVSITYFEQEETFQIYGKGPLHDDVVRLLAELRR